METLRQSPTDAAFVDDPYPFYHRARKAGPLVFWADYGLRAAVGHEAVGTILRDRRFGREVPPEAAVPVPERLAPFYDIEANSMLELEPPRHTRLRGLVLRAFTSRRIKTLAPEIETLCHRLIDAFPAGKFDLLPTYAQKVPIIVVARLLGVPEDAAPRLLAWSHAMVAMYQARRSAAVEKAAVGAATEFAEFLRGVVAERRERPGDDLITHLIAAEEAGDRLSTDEMIATCILLLNAGHEATVHSIGNGVKALVEAGTGAEALTQDAIAATVEEILRFDPPLHLFRRIAYEDVEIAGHTIPRGEEVALLLAAANRDPAAFADPDRFDPSRPAQGHASFGAGVHFCVGAPLARLELQIALRVLFARCPELRLSERPRYADLYHFHGLERLTVTT